MEYKQDGLLISDETSKRITSLRFLLIVLVIFIHNGTSQITLLNNPSSILGWRIIEQIELFISNGIASCSVPIFFMISAYLFGIKKESYLQVIKKKSKTLLIPYFVWPIINLILLVSIKLFINSLNSNILKNPDNIPVISWRLKEWIQCFLGYGSENNHPYVGQFWFVRDLFLFFVLSPVFNFLIEKCRITLFIFVFILYVFKIELYVFSIAGLFYFLCGYYLAKYGLDFFEIADFFTLPSLIFVFIVAYILSVLLKMEDSFLVTVLMSLLLLNFSKYLIMNESVFDVLKYLSRYSFFLFAIYQPFLLVAVISVWMKFFPLTSAFSLLIEYFIVPIIIIVIGTCIGIVMNRCIEPLYKLLNGGR